MKQDGYKITCFALQEKMTIRRAAKNAWKSYKGYYKKHPLHASVTGGLVASSALPTPPTGAGAIGLYMMKKKSPHTAKRIGILGKVVAKKSLDSGKKIIHQVAHNMI